MKGIYFLATAILATAIVLLPKPKAQSHWLRYTFFESGTGCYITNRPDDCMLKPFHDRTPKKIIEGSDAR